MATANLPDPPALSDLMAEGPVALFLDFDGTLIELADQPDGIVVPGDLLDRLHDLRDRLDGRLAIVTGRALDDLHKHVGACVLARAGSHGASCLKADGSRLGEEPTILSDAAVQAMQDFAKDRGLRFESKIYGGALHYRQHPWMEAEVLQFARGLAMQYELELKRGKFVVEVADSNSHKGDAVAAFLAEDDFAGARPIFVGDDLTDEDGFAGANSCGGFGIAVGERESQTARYHLADVSAVHAWLNL